MKKIQNIYKIVSNEKVCPKFFRLSLEAPSLAKVIQPGQFIHIRVTDGLEPFFRRPFSVFRAQKNVEILYDVVGKGTTALSKKKKGEKVDVLGPLGTSFSTPSKKIKQVVMIGGGIGIAPFLLLTDKLKRTKGIKRILLYGGRTKNHVFDMKAFRQNGCAVYVTTEDGGAGVKGRVSKLFNKIDLNPQTTFLYTCGPKLMMAAVQRFARENGIKGEASCEEVMACGLGACLGCSIQTRSGYCTVCYDGPVFDLDEVIF